MGLRPDPVSSPFSLFAHPSSVIRDRCVILPLSSVIYPRDKTPTCLCELRGASPRPVVVNLVGLRPDPFCLLLLSPIICHLSSVVCHPSSVIGHLSAGQNPRWGTDSKYGKNEKHPPGAPTWFGELFVGLRPDPASSPSFLFYHLSSVICDRYAIFHLSCVIYPRGKICNAAPISTSEK